FFFFSSRRRHTRFSRDWSSDVCSSDLKNEVYNVAVGDRTTLNELYCALQVALAENSKPYDRKPMYRDFRTGDVRHSQADISKARSEERRVGKECRSRWWADPWNRQ